MSGPTEAVLAAARLRAGDDVLQLGAADGRLVFAAHGLIGDGWVYTVDPSVDALEELLGEAHRTETAGVAYLVGDASALPLPDASVDACVGHAVFAAVGDAAEAARELHRVLRPGGRLAAAEPGTDGELAGALAAAGFADVELGNPEPSGGAVIVTARRP